MSLYRKSLMIAYCRECGSYGVPAEEKVYDPATGKNFYLCRDCGTVHQTIDMTLIQVVNGEEWSAKHPVKDMVLGKEIKKVGGK